jgi:galactose-1-phosphate uridylyltransferase
MLGRLPWEISMSDAPKEIQENITKARSLEKPTLLIATAALIFSLANTVLLVLNPTAKKVEQFNEEMKSEVAESVNVIHKKIDGLRSAEMEWQSVLKKASANPDAVYKVVNTKDGFLTLTEIAPQQGEGK